MTTLSKVKATPVLKDMQGNILSVGDKVAFVGYTNANSLTIGTIKKLHQKRADVSYKGLWSSRNVIEPINTRGLIKIFN